MVNETVTMELKNGTQVQARLKLEQLQRLRAEVRHPAAVNFFVASFNFAGHHHGCGHVYEHTPQAGQSDGGPAAITWVNRSLGLTQEQSFGWP